MTTIGTSNRTGVARRPPAAMYGGLALAVIGTLAPLLDMVTLDVLWEHVQAAYPEWGPELVAADRNAIAIYLVITGGLGILAWLGTIWGVATRKRWARAAVTTAFAAGVLVTLVNLTFTGGQYDLVLPALYRLVTALPTLAGLVVVVQVWRTGTRAQPRAPFATPPSPVDDPPRPRVRAHLRITERRST